VAMKRLDDLEQRVAYGAAAVAAVLSIALNVYHLPGSLLFALIGVVFAGVMVAAGQRRSRLLAGVAAYLLAFGPWHVALVGTPFLMVGLWMWFRGRPGPEELEARRQARDARMAERRASRGAGRGRGRSKAGADDDAGGGKKAPPPSKRYTPPGTRRR
jgi:hypothetical protein